MARKQTTFDSFNALAEPRRRELLEVLAGRQLTVAFLVKSLGWSQPLVSKHLAVLRKVELVRERKEGRQRVYQVNFDKLKPIQDWMNHFENLWNHRMDQLEILLDDLQV